MSLNEIKVLDKGYVRLVDWMGGDLSVVRSARVSYNAAWRAGENEGSDTKLINYLWRHQHMTPFESVIFTVEVKAPLFVFRQWHRHRTQSINELSARYTEVADEYYIPDVEVIGRQSTVNKQARDITELTQEQRWQAEMDVKSYTSHCDSAFNYYHLLLKRGWPRELARTVLPLSTYSTMFCTVNLRNLLHFLALRLDKGAQYEIRQYAGAILRLIQPIVPVCVAASGLLDEKV